MGGKGGVRGREEVRCSEGEQREEPNVPLLPRHKSSWGGGAGGAGPGQCRLKRGPAVGVGLIAGLIRKSAS